MRLGTESHNKFKTGYSKITKGNSCKKSMDKTWRNMINWMQLKQNISAKKKTVGTGTTQQKRWIVQRN